MCYARSDVGRAREAAVRTTTGRAAGRKPAPLPKRVTPVITHPWLRISACRAYTGCKPSERRVEPITRFNKLP